MKQLNILLTLMILFFVTSCGLQRNNNNNNNNSSEEKKEIKNNTLLLSKQYMDERCLLENGTYNLEKLKQIDFRIATNNISIPYAGGGVENGDDVAYYDEILIGESVKFIGPDSQGYFLFRCREYTLQGTFDPTGAVSCISLVGYKELKMPSVNFEFDSITKKKPSSGTTTSTSGGGL